MAEGKNPFKLCTPVANKMAFTVAWAVASAAITVSSIMSAGPVSAQVAIANKVSPSKVVCAGLMLLAKPSCALMAKRLAWALVKVALVATMPMLVLVPGMGVAAV